MTLPLRKIGDLAFVRAPRWWSLWHPPLRGRAFVAIVAALLLCGPTHIASALDVAVELIRLISPVAPFSNTTIDVKTLPDAACTIVVLYKSGPSRARGLDPQNASSRGRVSWTWRVGSSTTPGRWPVIVRCSVRDDVGEVRTLLEVR